MPPKPAGGDGDEPATKPPARGKAKAPTKEPTPAGGTIDTAPTRDEVLEYVLGLLLATA